MKLFKNLLIATAAVAVFTGVSAFAEEATDNTNYVPFNDFGVNTENVASSVVGVASADVSSVIAGMGNQVTVVIVPAGTTTISDDELIYYINQSANDTEISKAATTMLSSMGTKTLTEGQSYEIWVGGSNSTADTIKKATFKFASTAPEFQYGDVNEDTLTDSDDAMQILYYDNFMESIFDELDEDSIIFTAADVNQDTLIDSDDAMQIFYYDNFMESVLDDLLG